MGMKVIREAANHIDGRTSCPILYELFEAQSGLKTLDEINTFVNDMLMEKTQIASYAPLAEKAYELGDEAGLKILRECRDELFALVKDIYYKADLDSYGGEPPVELWLWGSVLLKNKIIAPELTDLLKKEFPSIQIKIPEKTALDTALDIAKS